MSVSSRGVISSGGGDPKDEVEQLIRQNQVLHESIIDLYLQVKIRSNEEVRVIGSVTMID